MKSLLEKAYDLVLMTIGLDLDAGERGAEPEQVVRVRLEIRGEVALDAGVSFGEMRLPPTLAAVSTNHGVSDARLPDRILAGLAEVTRERCPGEPVWLKLDTPSGHLPTVPWEYLLQPELRVPVIRLPPSALTPVASTETLEIAVCAARATQGFSYDVEALIDRLIAAVATTIPRTTRIHLFTDTEDAHRFRAGPDVTVYPLPERHETATSHEPTGEIHRGIPGRIDNEWLLWMLSALDGRSVDLLHFICPGYLTPPYGAVNFAEAPTADDRRPCTAVASAELISFLTRLGAWGIGFTIPERSAWPAAIRLLAHRIAHHRPGPVLVDAPYHSASSRGALQQAYGLLCGGTPTPIPNDAACSLYVNPGRVREALGLAPDERQRAFEEEIHAHVGELTLERDPSAGVLGGATEPPAWVAANQRTLETWAGAVLEAQVPGKHREAVVQGLNDGLKVVSEAVARYAREHGGNR